MAGAAGVAPAASSSRLPQPPARPLHVAAPTESHDVLLGFGEPVVGGVLNALVQSRQARWRAETAARDARISERRAREVASPLPQDSRAQEAVLGGTAPSAETTASSEAQSLARALAVLGEASDTPGPNTLDALPTPAFSQVLHTVQHAGQVLREHPVLGAPFREEFDSALSDGSEGAELAATADRGRPVDEALESDIVTISDTTESHRGEVGGILEGPPTPSVAALAEYYARLTLWEDEA
eukprot:1934108-Amphidinium_carterae.1